MRARVNNRLALSGRLAPRGASILRRAAPLVRGHQAFSSLVDNLPTRLVRSHFAARVLSSLASLDTLSQKRDKDGMAESRSTPVLKPLAWVGSSKVDLRAFPGPARREAGYALYLAQIGMKAL